jgi:hypothetical protein
MKKIALRPSITIRKNMGVNKQRQADISKNLSTPKQFTQMKLHTSTTSNLPFGDDVMEPTEE